MCVLLLHTQLYVGELFEEFNEARLVTGTQKKRLKKEKYARYSRDHGTPV